MLTEIRQLGRTRTAGVHRRDTDKERAWSPAGRSHFRPVVALVVVAVTWGVTFSVVDLSVVDLSVPDSGVTNASMTSMPPADLVAWRFGLGAAVLALIRRRSPSMPRTLRWRAVALGGVLGLGFLLQAWAITYTDAMMSGFLTGMLVVFAPIVGWLIFRVRPGGFGWLAVVIATAGLALLSLRGTGFGAGELLTLLAAAVWALHLVLLARWAEPEHAVALAKVQIATVAGMALLAVVVGAAITGGSPLPALPVGGGGWLGVLFLAVLATAAAMVLLSWAQSRMSATRAAVILTLEPAVAGVTAACLGKELGLKTVVGGVLLLTAMFVVELRGRPRARRGE